MPGAPHQERKLPFRIHPRVFKALGADLVTNDVVAIIELVKNSYDAGATSVDVRIGSLGEGQYIEICDNGSGMDLDILRDAWGTVATPYRQENPVVRVKGRGGRRAAGARGLGRLSAARLGFVLDMLTQTRGGECWRVRVDWRQLSETASLDGCYATYSRYDGASPFKASGTSIRISELRAAWDSEMIADLRDNLARLLSPFEPPDGFVIQLSVAGELDVPTAVVPPKFLDCPKYVIRGDADEAGLLRWQYEFRAIRGSSRRSANGHLTWLQVREDSDLRSINDMDRPTCGPFCFEIRAWDIAPQDTTEIAERFSLAKSNIRRDIRAYKGLSIYRDGVLVLPKSEGARDWLGLDLRRVGKVGPRLSTTQIVGHVAITADKNPDIGDTSDRERLARTPAVDAFQAILLAVVSVLENERDKDRRVPSKERRAQELFEKLNASGLVDEVTDVANKGGSAADALPLVQGFSTKLDAAREDIQTRFIYYSRLATVGTIAQMLIHEVRNRTTVIGNALEVVAQVIPAIPECAKAKHRTELAGGAVAALERLADTFAPLANRSFRRGRRTAVAEESILRCTEMIAGDLKAKGIRVSMPRESATEVSVDPGELDAIMLNLLTNAVFWLGQVPEDDRRIEVRLSLVEGRKRAKIAVHDSGPGVPEDDAERIFLPGVTNKPGGIGMGLTVASELVSEYGGQLALEQPGKLGGATFFFDLPIKSL